MLMWPVARGLLGIPNNGLIPGPWSTVPMRCQSSVPVELQGHISGNQ